MIVLKFGGTSVANAQNIQKVIQIVNQKAKDRMKKISQENPDKLREINRKAYLKRKEKILVKQNENIYV